MPVKFLQPPRNPHSTPLRRRPSLDFSLTGLVYCSMMMFMGLAAVNSQANLLFGVFGLMIGILLVCFIMSRQVLRRLRVGRDLPEHGVVGQPLSITYKFANGKRYWASLSVCLAELDGVESFTKQPQSYLLHAAPNNTAQVPTEIIPKRRGLVQFNRYQISTSFPFGFVKRAVERSNTDTLVIFPPIGKVDQKLIQLCQPAEKTGPTIRPRRGGVDEFFGMKEYRRGENPRWISWRRSARTGTLVVKEMTQVAPPRLLILVDTHAPEPTRQHLAQVERCIAMAGSLVSTALEQGLLVGTQAWGGDDWVSLPPTRGKRQRRDLLTLLARLPANSTHTVAQLVESGQSMLEAGTTAVLITPRNIELGLSDKLRGGMVVVSAESPQAKQWFKFEDIDFDHAIPTDQEETLKAGA